jgi:hypothetical protein
LHELRSPTMVTSPFACKILELDVEKYTIQSLPTMSLFFVSKGLIYSARQVKRGEWWLIYMSIVAQFLFTQNWFSTYTIYTERVKHIYTTEFMFTRLSTHAALTPFHSGPTKNYNIRRQHFVLFQRYFFHL